MLRLESLEPRLLLAVTITDSILPADDFLLDFPDATGVGQASAPAFIHVNNTGASQVSITAPALDSPDFTINYPMQPALPAGYDSLGADPINLNSSANGWLRSPTASDWYYFEASAGQLVTLQQNRDSLQRAEVTVYNAYGDTILSLENEGMAAMATSFAAFYGGTYYIQVEGLTPSDTGTYNLSLAATSNAIESIELSTGGATVTGTVTNSPQLLGARWYKFEADYGDSVRVTASVTDSIDTDVHLWNAVGQKIASGAATDTLTANLYATGTYYVQVDPQSFDPNYDPSVYSATLTKTGSFLNVPAGQTADIPVWFTPASVTPATETLTIATSDGGSTDITLTGTGQPGDFKVSALSAPNFARIGTQIEVAVTIRNAGPGNIIDEAPLYFALSTDAAYDPDTDILLGAPINLPTILAGETITIIQTLAIPQVMEGEGVPAEEAFYILAVVDPDGLVDEVDGSLADNTRSRSLTVSPYNTYAIDSDPPIDDSAIDFGVVPTGQFSNWAYVTVINRGDQAVALTDWTLADGSAFTIQNPNVPDDPHDDITLQPGQRVEIYVRFRPTDFEEGADPNLTDVLTINTDEGVTYEIDLFGAISGPDLLVTEDSGTPNDDLLVFGEVRSGITSDPVTVTLTNNGDQNLVINSFTFALGGASPYSIADAPSLPVTLATLESITIDVYFAPTATGPVADTLTIATNEPTPYPIALEGTGVAPNLLVTETLGEENDDLLPFGWQSVTAAVPASATLTMTNTGEHDLLIYNWTVTTAAFEVTRAESGQPETDFTIAPGESVDLTVAFVATTVGAYSDTLTIYNDDATYTVRLTGQAAEPQWQLRNSQGQLMQEASLDLGTHERGGYTVSDFVLLQNSSLVDLDLHSITIFGPGFSVAPLGVDVLAPGQNTKIALEFNPTPAVPLGEVTGSVNVTTSAANDIALELSVITVTPDQTLSASALDFGAVDFGASATRSLTIGNEGTSNLVISDWQFSSRQFALAAGQETELVIAPGGSRTISIVYTPNQVGAAAAQVTLTSNDLEAGQTNISLTGQSEGQSLTVPANSTYAFYDSTGNRVRLLLTNGQAEMFLDSGLATGGDIARLVITETTASARVLIISTGPTTIDTLIIPGSVAMLYAPNVSIGNLLQIDGAAETIQIDNVYDNAVITVADTAPRGVNISANHMGQNVTVNIAGPLQSLQVNRFDGGSVTAAGIGRVMAATGPLGADLNAASGGINQVIARRNITGDINAADSIGQVISLTGGIAGDVTAGAGINQLLCPQGAVSGNVTALGGGLNTLQAPFGITGNVLVNRNIGLLAAARGPITGVVRADSIASLNADAIDGALISVANRVNHGYVRTDIKDAHILAGYDIGMDGVANGNDTLSGGHIGNLYFSGELINSHVAVGVAPIYSPDIPPLTPPTSGQASSARVHGRAVGGDNGLQLFGFYYESHVGRFNTNLLPQLDFAVTAVA